MDYPEELQKLIDDNRRNTLPSVALDLVIFGFHERQLKVLLLRFRESQEWLLPGGRIRKVEDIDDSASRTLRERTGLDHLFLQQFHTFGKANRFINYSWQETMARMGLEEIDYSGYRDVSVGYYALVEFTKVNPTPDFLSDECRWWDIDQVPPLLFDHNEMIDGALKTLRGHLDSRPIGYNLLPETFTMTDLQSLYETILGRSLNRGNFYKQLMNYNVLDRLEKRPTIPSSKAPYLYRFNKERYDERLSRQDLFIS